MQRDSEIHTTELSQHAAIDLSLSNIWPDIIDKNRAAESFVSYALPVGPAGSSDGLGLPSALAGIAAL